MSNPRNKKSQEVMDKVRSLLRTGMDDRAVARATHMAKSTVQAFRQKNGIPANNKKKYLPRVMKDGKVVCKTCDSPKPRSEFEKNEANVMGIFYSCKKCGYRQKNARLSHNLKSYLGLVISSKKHMCKKKNIPFNLTVEYLIELYGKQQGKCFYTDRIMTHDRGKGHNPNSLSVDKIVSAKGYVEGNIVLCTSQANLVKNDLTIEEIRSWIPGWYSRLEAYERETRTAIGCSEAQRANGIKVHSTSESPLPTTSNTQLQPELHV